ncbi:uncharacterized protein LOC134236338 isoform X2 [Saccostrea cucullata]|uniref:uncharacterized protein LOC134236338 isoform X2 n=1 Tax=Saccostrea cuccullata TaxID=36930 RepID=UPI002ECFE0DC
MWMVKFVSFMYIFVYTCTPTDPSVKYVHIGYDMDWSTADKSCGKLNGALIRITDIEAIVNITGEGILKTISPFWSSITGSFSPWIAYRGCYPQSGIGINISKWTLNSVGNCFFQCKNQSPNPDCTYFALGGDTCYCLCSLPKVDLADSKYCNIICNNSIDDGFCGGNGYVTLYEANSYNGTGDGFCMAYDCSGEEFRSFGHDCNERYEGYCVNHSNYLLKQEATTWNSYSMMCKNLNHFLAASITKNSDCMGYIWIGIRRYEIHQSNEGKFRNGCYKIKKGFRTWLYEKSDCSEKLSFICKVSDQIHNSSISPTLPHSTETVTTKVSVNINDSNNSSISPTLPHSTETVTTKVSVNINDSNTLSLVTGTVSGIIGLLIVIVVTVVFVRRKQGTLSKGTKHVQNAIYELQNSNKVLERDEDIIYMNTINEGRNNNQLQPSPNTNEIYVEKEEGEYDHLRTSRTKQNITNEDPFYENTYSTTTREDITYGAHYDSMNSSGESNYNYSKDIKQANVYGSHYDYLNSSEENQYDSSYINHKKGFVSDYSSLEENTYDRSNSAC